MTPELNNKLINGLSLFILGTAIASALAGLTDTAIAGIAIYLTAQHITKGGN